MNEDDLRLALKREAAVVQPGALPHIGGREEYDRRRLAGVTLAALALGGSLAVAAWIGLHGYASSGQSVGFATDGESSSGDVVPAGCQGHSAAVSILEDAYPDYSSLEDLGLDVASRTQALSVDSAEVGRITPRAAVVILMSDGSVVAIVEAHPSIAAPSRWEPYSLQTCG